MLTHTTHQITHKPTPPRSLPPQKGKGKGPPPHPRPPPIAEEAPEEGGDPNFVSDTNNLITIKQNGPTLREIRDTDMGAAITYLLLDLEGVDTEPDILDDGKKGPWTIFATADCEEQFNQGQVWGQNRPHLLRNTNRVHDHLRGDPDQEGGDPLPSNPTPGPSLAPSRTPPRPPRNVGQRLGLVLYIDPGWGYGGGPRPRRGVGRGRGGRAARAGPLSPAPCPWSGSHCDPTEILEFVRLAVFWAVRVGRRVLWLWVRWKDLFQTLPMVPGSSGVSQRFLCCGHGKLECWSVGVGVCVQGASNDLWVVDWIAHGREFTVGLKKAGSADPVEEMAAGALRGL
eukprot:scaffold10191_cov108-Isochrysis_galbana.AAC.18